MKTTKRFFALSDSFTGDNPNECTGGFANTKTVIFFTSKKARAEWLESTRILNARALTRDEARRLANRESVECRYTESGYAKMPVARPYGSDQWENEAI